MTDIPSDGQPGVGDPDAPGGASDRDDELFRRYRETGSRRVRNQLVERHMGLAAHIAKRFGRSSGADDVRQVAMLGLVKAVDRFDPEHGATFSSFAGLTIEGEIKRHFRDRTWTVRVPRSSKELHLLIRTAGDRLTQRLGRSPTIEEIATELRTERDEVLRGLAAGAAYQVGSLDTAGEDDTAAVDRITTLAADERGYADSERRQVVTDLLDGLSGRERQIVELRFYSDKSQSEIADIIGISQMHVSRLLRRSFEQMRARLDDD